MKQVLRRALTGLLGGTFLSPVLCLAFRDAGLGLALGALLGIVQALAFFDRERKSALDCAMTSGALGLPAWAAINVLLSSGEGIPSESFIWTAGAAPNPIVQTLPVDHDRRGADVVEPKLRLRGYANVWALGDCASVPDVKPAKACPPTAQAAIREAAVLAHNLRASLLGQPLNAFHLKLLGSLCVVGYHTACAEIGGLKFSGLFAWLLWRGVYLGKLPGLERKVRVLIDSTLELFFPRDIVQTMEFSDGGLRPVDRTVRTP